jgi:hypothetical protein
MLVKILRLGRSAETVNVDDDTSVKDALDKADVELVGHSVTLNGVGCDLAAPLPADSVITVSPKVMGGV